MSPIVCNYFLTLRCNDQCEFCDIGPQYANQQIQESPLEIIKENLKDLKKLGVLYVDFTGGEPFLRDDLPQILKAAKDLKMFVCLTTNGILYQKHAEAIKGMVDRLIFSIDSPVAEEHNRIRGQEIFDIVIQAIKQAKKLGEHPVINYTITRNSLGYLPEMVELAESLGVFLWISPVHGISNTQGFTRDSIQHIKYFDRRKNVGMHKGMLDFIGKNGNRTASPRCRAANSVITILPDNTLVAPCFYEQFFKRKINNDLFKIYKDPEILKKSRQIQGRDQICQSCMVSSYMLPSFLYQLDKYFVDSLFFMFRFFWKEFQYKRRKNR